MNELTDKGDPVGKYLATSAIGIGLVGGFAQPRVMVMWENSFVMRLGCEE